MIKDIIEWLKTEGEQEVRLQGNRHTNKFLNTAKIIENLLAANKKLEKETDVPKDYFFSEDFDTTPEFLLKELAQRAEYWSKKTDGNYSFPSPNGQVRQIYEMAIAAQLKMQNQTNQKKELYWRDLESNETLKAGDRFYSDELNSWVVLQSDNIGSWVYKNAAFIVQRPVYK